MARHPILPALLVALPLAAGLVACGAMVRGTYPDRDLETVAPGVIRPVDIFMDNLGVPHVYAQDAGDAAYAVGFLHARDRAFQLELIRLASQGRLTELLGEDLLEVDRRLRILTYKLDEAAANLPPKDAEEARAYCAGINAGAQIHPTPMEFKLLKHTPEPWTPRDLVAVARLQAWDLSVDAAREAARDRVLGEAPEAAQTWLMTPSSHLGYPIVSPGSVEGERPELAPFPAPPSGSALISEAPSAPERDAPGAPALAPPRITRAGLTEGALAWAAGFEDQVGGSNAWAVSAGKSAGSVPILSGDPHISLGWPNFFYEVHLHTPDVDVSGGTIPGMPIVAIGRSTYVGWTLTTSYADAQDLFSLKVDPEDPMRYEVDGEWEAFEAWPQTFKMGDEERAETYRVSRFGPVYNPGREAKLRAGRTYALTWPGLTDQPLPVTRAFGAVARAKSVDEVVDAIRGLPMPSQNWTFATADGHIGYVLGGALPAHRASPLPRDGTRSDTAWKGLMPESERPVVIDPPEGYIVASNQPVMPDATRFNHYGSGAYRAMSLNRRLQARDGWTTDQMRGLQVDLLNAEAAHLTGPILELLASHDFSTESDARYARIQKMIGILKGWDHRMEATQSAPLLYESLRSHMMAALFTPWLGDGDVYRTWAELRLSEAPYYHALLTEDGARFWDDPGTEGVETRGGRVAQALMAAEAELSATFGSDIESWSWGEAHVLALAHPFASKRILKPIFGIDPMEMPGGRHTIFALDHLGIFGDYGVKTGPVIRQVVAPGQEAGFVLAGGNAGQPGHPYALNQLDAWAYGEQHTAGGQRGAIEASSTGHIQLKPTP